MNKMYKIVERTKIWFTISIVIIVIGLGALVARGGLNLGIDFTSGTVMTVSVGQVNEAKTEDVRKMATKYDASARVLQSGEDDIEVISNSLTDIQNANLLTDIKVKFPKAALVSSDRIGPTIGDEITRNAFIASLLAIVGILIYVSIRFEFKSAIAAIVSLVHDLLIMLAVYALFNLTVNSSFIAAMLTVLGYSINDTIVVFDRIRENKKLGKFEDITSLINGSITQTMARSINTVMTVLITIASINIFGVPSVREFAFPLLIGIASGMYSSIFIASPVWYMFMKKEKVVQ